MNIFITGANGFVGSTLTSELFKEGHRLKCLVRKTSNLRWIEHLTNQSNVELVFGDLQYDIDLQDALSDIDLIIHCAASTLAVNKEKYFQANVETTKRLADYAKLHCKNLKRFIFLSSQAASGASSSEKPKTETDEDKPLSLYGLSKLEAEKQLKQYTEDFPITILRPPTIYGPKDVAFLQVFEMLKYNVLFTIGNGKSYVNMIFVDDVVNAIKTVFNEQDNFSLYYITDGNIYSWDDVSRILMEIISNKALRIKMPVLLAKFFMIFPMLISKIIKKPFLIQQRIKEMSSKYLICSDALIREKLGYKPQTFLKEGLKITYRWYKENNWL